MQGFKKTAGRGRPDTIPRQEWLKLSVDPARSAHYPARSRAGVLAIFKDLLAVHKYVQHTGRVLVRINEGRVILDRIGIEDDPRLQRILPSVDHAGSSRRFWLGNAANLRIASSIGINCSSRTYFPRIRAKLP